MLENPSDPAPNIKRYAPPSQRNRVLNRRKSVDRFERGNYYSGNNGDKNQFTPSRNISGVDHVETGSTNLNENPHHGLIPLDGCSTSLAAQIMNERWAAAMHACSDLSVEASERPVMYSGATGSAWNHTKFPPQMDFLAELRRAMRNANASVTVNSTDAS